MAGTKHVLGFRALPDLYEIVEDNPDIVSICTPNHTHYEIAMEYLDKCHVILEKPTCASLKQADDLIQKEQETGNRVFPVFQFRYAGHDPVTCSIKTYWTRNFIEYYHSWKGQPDKVLGGCVITHAIHAVDLMLASYGKPNTVCCESVDYQYNSLENHCIFSMGDRYVNTTLSEYRRGNCFRFGDSLVGFTHQFHLIANKILDDTFPLACPTLQDARDSLEIVTAVYYSEYVEDAVMLPLAPSHPFYEGWTRLFEHRRQRSQSSQRISV